MCIKFISIIWQHVLNIRRSWLRKNDCLHIIMLVLLCEKIPHYDEKSFLIYVLLKYEHILLHEI